MLQNTPQADGKKTTGQGKGGGPKTITGRANQIESRINHGIHYECPVIPQVESPEAWERHLAEQQESLKPVGGFERFCVYVVALRQWQFFRLVRHELAIVAKAITQPDNGFTSSYDEDYVLAGDVAEVLRRPESLEEELFEMRDFMLRVSALADNDFTNITFTSTERRQILSAIIKQPTYDANGLPVKSKIPKEFLNGLSDDDGYGDDDNDDDELAGDVSDDGEDINDAAADNEDAVVTAATQLRGEIEEITKFKGVNLTESLQELVDTLAGGIKERQRRLEVASTHIGLNLIPSDEKTVARLTNYQRQINADISRHLNSLLRSQALRSGQVVPPPISLDVNFTGEQGNGSH